jgi:hypothetical protein
LHVGGFYCLNSTLRLLGLDYEPVVAVTVHTAKMSEVRWFEWDEQTHVSGMDGMLLSLVEPLMGMVFGRSSESGGG